MPENPKSVAQAPKTVRFKLNGRDLEVPLGTSIIEAARRVGVHIPYFCYHPGLTSEGNCRMCLVEVAKLGKPVPACTTPVTEGMEVFTESEPATKARADVLEFMLVNHPLDCPVCDKSGECLLQDHSYDHGKDRSRMVESKELKPTKDLGANISIWGNRCIVCTRCVRFCDEVAGTGELTVVNRGDHSVVDVFRGYPLQNPLAGNVVDICPVGALISTDFLYQARVWLEKKTDSSCVACARGCNIVVESLHNKVKRLVARHNPHVNDYWICDHGRHDHHYILGPRRWLRCETSKSSPPGDASEVVATALRSVVKRHGPNSVGAVASAFMTLESAFLFRQIFEVLGVPPENVGARARPRGEEMVFPGGFKISGDRNPNRVGVERLLSAEAFDERLSSVLERARAGELKALVIVNDLPHHDLEEEWIEALGTVDFGAVLLLERDSRIPAPVLLIPATAFTEREGSVINEDNRVQRLRRATEAPRGVRDEVDVFQGILESLGDRDVRRDPAGVFLEIREVVPELDGLTHQRLGPLGHQLGSRGEQAPSRRKDG